MGKKTGNGLSARGKTVEKTKIMATAELSNPTPALKLYAPTPTCPRCRHSIDQAPGPRTGGGIGVWQTLRIKWSNGKLKRYDDRKWWMRARSQRFHDEQGWRSTNAPSGYVLAGSWAGSWSDVSTFIPSRWIFIPALPTTEKLTSANDPWRPIPFPQIESLYPCATCQHPFQTVDQLLDHLRDGCWQVCKFDAIPRTSQNSELDWRLFFHTHFDAIRYDNGALGELLILATPILRYAAGLTPFHENTAHDCDRKQYLQWVKNSVQNPAISKKTNRPMPYDLSGDGMSIGYLTIITDIERTRERQRNKKGWPKLKSEEEAYGQETAWMEDEFHRWSNLTRSAIQSEKSKDRNHGVTKVPTRKKEGGKAKGKCKRKAVVPRPVRADDQGYSEHKRFLTEDHDVGIRRETILLAELQCNRGIGFGEHSLELLDIDACVKFCPKGNKKHGKYQGHDRFVRVWDWLTERIAIHEGILNEDGSLRFDGWLRDNIGDATDRKILTLMAKPPYGKKLSQKNAGQRVDLTISKVKTRWKRLVRQICKKLEFSDEIAEQILAGNKWKSPEKREYRSEQSATIDDLATIIETRRCLEPSHWFRFVRHLIDKVIPKTRRQESKHLITDRTNDKINRRILSLRGLPCSVIAEFILGEFAVKLNEAEIQARRIIPLQAA